jgi:hypothetical protein
MSQEEAPAPAGLGARGKRLWADTLAIYRLTPTELVILEEIARRADEQARLERVVRSLRPAELVVEGYMGQPRAHPLLDQLLRYDEVIGKLSKQLGLLPLSQRGLKGLPGGKSSARVPRSAG